MNFVLEHSIASQTLEAMLGQQPPEFLYHYTNPEGLIGILKSKELWATNIDYLNDSHEIDYCVEYIKSTIEYMMEGDGGHQSVKAFLKESLSFVGSASKVYYLTSLSEEADSLPQWRAYCPNGGYALGISSKYLAKISAAQGFRLVKCCYDYVTMQIVVSEWIEFFASKFKNALEKGVSEETAATEVAWQFGQHVARFGSTFKHPSFKEEVEWRILSESINDQNEKIEFRVRDGIIIPYFRISLVTSDLPKLYYSIDDFSSIVVRCGPFNKTPRSQLTVQSLLSRYLQGGAYGPSNIPYKMK